MPEDPVAEAFIAELQPFFEALQKGDKAGIIKVIGEERYNKANALTSQLEEGFEPYYDYINIPIEKQDTNKHMAWLLKNAAKIEMPKKIYKYEEVEFPGEDPMTQADLQFEGSLGPVYCTAFFVADGNGGYTLKGFALSSLSIHEG